MIVDVDSFIENAWDSLLRFIMDLLKLGMRIEKESVERENHRDIFPNDNSNEVIEIEKQEKTEKVNIDVNDNNNNNKHSKNDNESSGNNIRTFYIAEADSHG